MSVEHGLDGSGSDTPGPLLSPAEAGADQDGSERLEEAGSALDGVSRPAFVPEASMGFVSSPYVERLTQRALTYLEIGYPVHLAGFAGTAAMTRAESTVRAW